MSHLKYAWSGYLDATIYILKCKIYFASYPIIFCDTPYERWNDYQHTYMLLGASDVCHTICFCCPHVMLNGMPS